MGGRLWFGRLGALLLGPAAAPVAAVQPQTLTVTATVQNQVCLGGDRVLVVFRAVATSSHPVVGRQWDLNGDGLFDTPARRRPLALRAYPDEALVTIGLQATDGHRYAPLWDPARRLRPPGAPTPPGAGRTPGGPALAPFFDKTPRDRPHRAT